MAQRVASGPLKPDLSDVFLVGQVIGNSDLECLSDTEFRVMMRLIYRCAINSVWTYTAPNGGALPNDPEKLRRYAMVSPQTWRKVWPAISEFFIEKRGCLYLAKDWIHIGNGRPDRAPLQPAVRESVAKRDGHKCRYCGSNQGPFDVDHIVPVARGGGDEIGNLVLACVPCNHSKGAKLLREWKP